MQRVIFLGAVVLLAGCDSVDRLSAGCEAKGLTPGTVDFEQCYAAAATPKDLSLPHATARQMMLLGR